MLPWCTAPVGRLDEHVIDSVLLRDNPLGDPARRPLWVYVALLRRRITAASRLG
jgi:hypothetical protein